jgi:uncharacterized protein
VPVVRNSSPLILCARIGRIELLRAVFDYLLIPPAVHQEVVVRGKGRPGAAEVENGEWIRSRALERDEDLAALLARLYPGEAEAIALAVELGSEIVVILDDYQARRLARERSVETVGSGGVPVLAKRQGLIPAVRPLLDELRLAGLHMSHRIYTEILAEAGEATVRPDDAAP